MISYAYWLRCSLQTKKHGVTVEKRHWLVCDSCAQVSMSGNLRGRLIHGRMAVGWNSTKRSRRVSRHVRRDAKAIAPAFFSAFLIFLAIRGNLKYSCIASFMECFGVLLGFGNPNNIFKNVEGKSFVRLLSLLSTIHGRPLNNAKHFPRAIPVSLNLNTSHFLPVYAQSQPTRLKTG